MKDVSSVRAQKTTRAQLHHRGGVKRVSPCRKTTLQWIHGALGKFSLFFALLPLSARRIVVFSRMSMLGV